MSKSEIPTEREWLEGIHPDDPRLPDNTQELDGLVERILEPHFDEDELSSPDWTPGWSIYQGTKSETKRAILDWHNKQVGEVLDRLEATKRTADLCTDDTYVVKQKFIEAERNKLKEGYDDKKEGKRSPGRAG